VDSPQGLAAYEALQRLDSKREYSERKRSLYRKAAEAETIQVVRQRVFRAVNDSQIFWATALDHWLGK
jgi:hypothetical protein